MCAKDVTPQYYEADFSFIYQAQLTYLVKHTMCDGLKNVCWCEKLIAVAEKFKSVEINVSTNKCKL